MICFRGCLFPHTSFIYLRIYFKAILIYFIYLLNTEQNSISYKLKYRRQIGTVKTKKYPYCRTQCWLIIGRSLKTYKFTFFWLSQTKFSYFSKRLEDIFKKTISILSVLNGGQNAATGQQETTFPSWRKKRKQRQGQTVPFLNYTVETGDAVSLMYRIVKTVRHPSGEN